MNKPTILLACALPLAACSSAHAATRTYGVTSFDQIRIAGPFDVHIRVGGTPGAHATGPQEALDRLSVEQQDDVLVVKSLPGGWGGWPSASQGKVVVDVVAPQLSNIALTGSGDVTVDRVKGDALDVALSGSGDLSVGAVAVARLGAVMTGSGDLSLAGTAQTAKAVVTGSGDLKAADLAGTDVTATLLGSGDLTIGARHSAAVTLSGSGDVDIVGPAACTVHRTGSGDVRCDHPAQQ